MGRNLAEYRLYKSIGYSDAEIELMQQDAKIIQDSLYMVNVQERIIELTKYHYYNSDGSWMPGGSKFWDERFEEEWKRKLEKDKFMPHSKREQYKNIVALELSELVEQYIDHYGIVGNELMNIATDEYLEYLTRPQNTAPPVDPEPDNRELWERIYERFLDECKNHKHRLAYFSYLYWRLQDDKLISADDWPHGRFKRKLASDGVLNNEEEEFDKLKERNSVRNSPAQNVYNAILENVR